jgi:hypothetical protein
MNNFSALLLILNTLITFGQSNYGLDNYQWNKLKKVTLLKNVETDFETDSLMVSSLEKTELKSECENIFKFKKAFATLPYGPNKDVILEKTYILLCEFENGEKIPFRYFPTQYTIFDMRKAYRHYYSFPEKNNRMRNAIKSCIKQLDRE